MFGGGRNDLADRLKATAEDLVELVTAQIRLTRLELATDAKAVGTRLARIALFVPLILLGYAFIMGAIVALLARPLGLPGALLLVGAVNLGLGLFGAVRAARGIGAVTLLDRSRGEVKSSVKQVVAAAHRPDESDPLRGR